MTETVKIAIIGTGWWATANHIPGAQQHDAAEIVALCDIDTDKVASVAQTYNVPHIYTNIETMLDSESLDGVVIATYHATHYEVAKACLERGLSILLEKPMTLYARDARHLIELAQANNSQIVMGYNHNHMEFTTRAREIIHSGEIGAIQYMHGFFGQSIMPLLRGKGKTMSLSGTQNPDDVYSDPSRSGGGHGHLQLTHLCGMVAYVTGLKPVRVQAMMHNLGLAVDVINAVTVVFENGVLGTLGGTSNMHGARKFDLSVFCENGWLTIDDAAGSLTIHREGTDPETIVTPVIAQKRQHNTINNFIDILTHNATNINSGEVGWRAVEILDAAYQSAARDGATVEIKSLY